MITSDEVAQPFKRSQAMAIRRRDAHWRFLHFLSWVFGSLVRGSQGTCGRPWEIVTELKLPDGSVCSSGRQLLALAMHRHTSCIRKSILTTAALEPTLSRRSKPRERSRGASGRVVVELKRDVIVRGTLESVDAGLGLTLTDVSMEDLQVSADPVPGHVRTGLCVSARALSYTQYRPSGPHPYTSSTHSQCTFILSCTALPQLRSESGLPASARCFSFQLPVKSYESGFE